MLCQECRIRPATVKITTISGQTKEQLHLCEECARKRGEVEFGGEGQISLGEMLAAFLHQQGVVKPATPEEPGPGPCPACGLTYERLARTGKLGCSECFTHFGPQLRSILRHVHGNARHAGRMPKRTGGPLRIQHDINRLKRELATCVQVEDFERAAQLRDEIRQLERSIQPVGAVDATLPKEEVDPA